ncbi:MAG: phosphoribosylanthranilate isomerase [Synergistaceae bacterium]|nr:phosphoribosylanthranilate isomerase [Synergistaceae bacterium]MBP9625859.1 phosphoribosylanthranilate isomerase [Synergistaceae bacterium]MBP9957884.1 phosphoribosylanthranilate isomerase [Synergistaceae bacterium]
MSVRIKVCGLRRAEDVGVCVDAGVDFVGFIFTPLSPRYVEPSVVAGISSGKALRVGVFVDQPVEEVRRVAEQARLDFVQLHGQESPEEASAIGAHRVIKAFWPSAMTPEEMTVQMARYADACAYYLLDAGKGGGGHGTILSLACIKRLCPPRPFFLAGGLGAENVAEAVGEVAPFGVDLNSMLERAPGIKDAQKIIAAVGAIRSMI